MYVWIVTSRTAEDSFQHGAYSSEELARSAAMRVSRECYCDPDPKWMQRDPNVICADWATYVTITRLILDSESNEIQ